MYVLGERVLVEAGYVCEVVATNPCSLLNAVMTALRAWFDYEAMMVVLCAQVESEVMMVVLCTRVECDVEVVLCARVECVVMMAV